MTSKDEPSLVEQRQLLRQRLRAQRQLIAHQLGPGPMEHGSYPRSMTMRFLSRRPGMATRVLTELAIVLVGARFFRSITTVLTLSRLLRPPVVLNRSRLAQQRFPSSSNELG